MGMVCGGGDRQAADPSGPLAALGSDVSCALASALDSPPPPSRASPPPNSVQQVPSPIAGAPPPAAVVAPAGVPVALVGASVAGAVVAGAVVVVAVVAIRRKRRRLDEAGSAVAVKDTRPASQGAFDDALVMPPPVSLPLRRGLCRALAAGA